jgi:hypothetical protein
MLKAKKLGAALLILPLILCLYLSGMAVGADPCFQGFSTIPGSVKYAFKWDPTNPEEVNPNSNVEIKVIGGKSPYFWSVNEENGFSLEHGETSGLYNTLHADSSACGAAEIVVTDDLGEIVTGYVRCTTGQWVWVCSGDDSRWSSCWPNPYGNDWVWVWDDKGKYKYHLGMGCHYSPYHCLFSSCEGHTAYIPPAWQGEMCYGSCLGRPQCNDIGYIGCCYGQVKLRVYEWTCP